MKFILNILRLILITTSFSSAYSQPLCHDNERSTLLQFKLSFSLAKFASIYPIAYPKTQSWEPTGSGSNCCLWDGIACDKESSHVISLDLSSSYLYGFFESNSTIFDLVHLQNLNLADNDFRYSLIPPKIGRLSNLKFLNLSRSTFFGQVPIEISKFPRLISLDLSYNEDPLSGAKMLRIQKPNLRTLIQNFTALKILDLSEVLISSRGPKILADCTSLTYLALEDYGLHGSC
ncbi:hypothetical protein Ancab_039681 [Ancistrocladus abbreviatus]